MSSVMGSVIMAIRTPGLRDFIMKVRSSSSRRVAPASPALSAEPLRRPAQVPADEGESWRSVVMDNGATEDAGAAAVRLQAFARQRDAKKQVVKRLVEKETGSQVVTPDGKGMLLYVRGGQDGAVVGDCPFCHKVLMALRLKEISPTLLVVGADLRAPGLSLMAQTPCLPTLALADGTTYGDSESVLEYLHRDYSGRGAPLLVEGNEDMARAVSPLWDTLQTWYASADGAEAVAALLEEAVADLNSRCARLSRDDFLLSTPAPSAIDCNLAPKLLHLSVIAKELKGWDITDGQPELSAYMDRVFATDAFKETAPSREDVIWGWAEGGTAKSSGRLA